METVENISDLNFTVCRDCEAVMFYGGKWFEGYVRCGKLVSVAVVERHFVNFASSWWQ